MYSHPISDHQYDIIPISPLSDTFNCSVKNQQMLKEPTTSPSSLISFPTTFDILLGKDSSIYNHDGNRRFRSIIYSHIDEYMASPSKTSKSKIVQDLHADLQKSGYRFLRKMNDNRGFGFTEIKSREARQKISHALRDGARERQKKNPSSPLITVDRSSSLVGNMSAKTRRQASQHNKRKIDIDLTPKKPLMRNMNGTMQVENQESHAQASECQSDCPSDTVKFQHNVFSDRPRRVSLVQEDNMMNCKGQQQRKQGESLTGNIIQERHYPFQSEYNAIIGSKEQYTSFVTMDKHFHDYEPLDPSLEHGFLESRNGSCLFTKYLDNPNLDQLLSVVRSL